MQTVYETPKSLANKISEAPAHIPFCNLFPADLQLAWNMEDRILSLISVHEPRIIAQQQFTRNEWLLLMSLVEFYPQYAPHEMLLAELTLVSCDEWRLQLQKIRQVQPEAVIQELRPVYRALSGVRSKLKKFYPKLRISLVRNLGYVFSLAPETTHAN